MAFAVDRENKGIERLKDNTKFLHDGIYQLKIVRGKIKLYNKEMMEFFIIAD